MMKEGLEKLWTKFKDWREVGELGVTDALRNGQTNFFDEVAQKNGCGIPWNWSGIHHRGKTFLDMAGRILSCGLSDSRLKKGIFATNGRHIFEMPMAFEHSSSYTKSDAEALSLLVEAYVSVFFVS